MYYQADVLFDLGFSGWDLADVSTAMTTVLLSAEKRKYLPGLAAETCFRRSRAPGSPSTDSTHKVFSAGVPEKMSKTGNFEGMGLTVRIL